MTKVEILGANRLETHTRTRGASRAVIVRDGMILLIHEACSDLWIVPGGGIEEGETPEKCCVREAEEETGNLVLPLREFTVLSEYYEEYCYITHYFICEVTGLGRMHLTEAEVRRGAEPKWIPFPEAMDIFSRHQSYADINEEKRGIYLREYTALQEYLKTQPQNTDTLLHHAEIPCGSDRTGECTEGQG